MNAPNDYDPFLDAIEFPDSTVPHPPPGERALGPQNAPLDALDSAPASPKNAPLDALTHDDWDQFHREVRLHTAGHLCATLFGIACLIGGFVATILLLCYDPFHLLNAENDQAASAYFAPILAAILLSTGGLQLTKYKRTALVKEKAVRAILSQHFQNLTYDYSADQTSLACAETHDIESVFTGWNKASVSDIIQAEYKNHPFRFYDLHLTHASRKNASTLFRGQLLILKLPPHGCPNLSINNKRSQPKRSWLHKVLTGESDPAGLSAIDLQALGIDPTPLRALLNTHTVSFGVAYANKNKTAFLKDGGLEKISKFLSRVENCTQANVSIRLKDNELFIQIQRAKNPFEYKNMLFSKRTLESQFKSDAQELVRILDAAYALFQ